MLFNTLESVSFSFDLPKQKAKIFYIYIDQLHRTFSKDFLEMKIKTEIV